MNSGNSPDTASSGPGRWVTMTLLLLGGIGAVALISGIAGSFSRNAAPVAAPSTTVSSLETSTTIEGAEGPWETLPEAPIEWRAANTAVWTGEEFITWGATAGSTDRLAFDGAAYSPFFSGWRVLPDSGLATWVGYEQVWTDQEVVLWGTTESGLGDTTGMAYDPVSDAWRAIVPDPDFGIIDSVWTGEEILVLGESGEPEYSRILAAYRPATETWEHLAPPPEDVGIFQLTAWANGRLLAWGDDIVDDQVDDRIARGFAYDSGTDSWNELAPTPIPGRWGHAAVWTGAEVVIFGGQGEYGEFRNGAAYNPENDTWRLIPDMPLAPSFNQIAVWTGMDILVWGGQARIPDSEGFITYSDGAAYKPEFDAWRPLAPAPAKVKADSYAAEIDGGGGAILWGTSGGFHFKPVG